MSMCGVKQWIQEGECGPELNPNLLENCLDGSRKSGAQVETNPSVCCINTPLSPFGGGAYLLDLTIKGLGFGTDSVIGDDFFGARLTPAGTCRLPY